MQNKCFFQYRKCFRSHAVEFGKRLMRYTRELYDLCIACIDQCPSSRSGYA